MAKLIRKNVSLDPEVLRRAQEILGTQNASETIREALNLVAFRRIRVVVARAGLGLQQAPAALGLGGESLVRDLPAGDHDWLCAAPAEALGGGAGGHLSARDRCCTDACGCIREPA